MFELVVILGPCLPNLLFSCMITVIHTNQSRTLLLRRQAIEALPWLVQVLELAGEVESKVLPMV